MFDVFIYAHNSWLSNRMTGLHNYFFALDLAGWTVVKVS